MNQYNRACQRLIGTPSISVRTAIAAEQGRLWGRCMQWVVDRLVFYPGHCENELEDWRNERHG